MEHIQGRPEEAFGRMIVSYATLDKNGGDRGAYIDSFRKRIRDILIWFVLEYPPFIYHAPGIDIKKEAASKCN
ncbi:hypothetical protein C900_04545 [Fulvivirga imtechensis AK7]|uniref:Uncharacterized protein n=1 Tax=Fulvivirga imtechensis AK7 TaxID=1237149 RepID=L8JR75_9BACT|nr:hypothetical protein C900_04545 [Fulvivirga imtechensis AK7]